MPSSTDTAGQLLSSVADSGKSIISTVIALILMTWITDEMELHTINWILNQLLTVGLLAFVVLFQPELRYMLSHLGDMKIGQLFGFASAQLILKITKV